MRLLVLSLLVTAAVLTAVTASDEPIDNEYLDSGEENQDASFIANLDVVPAQEDDVEVDVEGHPGRQQDDDYLPEVNYDDKPHQEVNQDDEHYQEGHQDDENQSEGHYDDEHQSEGHYDDEHQSEGHYDDEHQSEGHYDDEHQSEGHYDDENQPEGHYDDEHQPEGHYDDEHQPEGHYDDENQPEGHYDDENQPEGHYDDEDYTEDQDNNNERCRETEPVLADHDYNGPYDDVLGFDDEEESNEYPYYSNSEFENNNANSLKKKVVKRNRYKPSKRRENRFFGSGRRDNRHLDGDETEEVNYNKNDEIYIEGYKVNKNDQRKTFDKEGECHCEDDYGHGDNHSDEHYRRYHHGSKYPHRKQHGN